MHRFKKTNKPTNKTTTTTTKHVEDKRLKKRNQMINSKRLCCTHVKLQGVAQHSMQFILLFTLWVNLPLSLILTPQALIWTILANKISSLLYNVSIWKVRTLRRVRSPKIWEPACFRKVHLINYSVLMSMKLSIMSALIILCIFIASSESFQMKRWIYSSWLVSSK